MNILIVDHVCHRRTKSFDFLRDLLQSRFCVDVFYYVRHYDCHIPTEKIEWADVVVFLEFIPFRFSLGISGKRCVFVPMYDNEWASVGLWRRLAVVGMNVVSFSRRVTDHALRCGVANVLDVRFAVDPKRFSGMAGNPHVVALWERGAVAFRAVKQMFEPQEISKVVVVRRPDERISYEPISHEDAKSYKVEIHESGFLSDEDYLQLLKEPGIYIAPRLKEGIGMSFLEQMAMGKCVIAHDDATMNEYIEDGRNGILVDMLNPRHVEEAEIARARNNVVASANLLYEKWRADSKRVIEFFSSLENVEPLRSPWNATSVFWYVVYWAEGAAMFLSRILKNGLSCARHSGAA